MNNLPIFIISKDRPTPMRVCLASIERQEVADHVIVPVIVDTGSTFPAMLDYLAELESRGIVVYRYPETDDRFADLNMVKTASEHYLEDQDCPVYGVTDPDIELMCGGVVQACLDVLNMSPGALCVGPAMRLSDIPDTYPHKAEVWKQFIRHYNGQLPIFGEAIKGRMITGVHARIDTTFNLRRTADEYARRSEGICLYAPHDARHLDWYKGPEDITDEDRHYWETGKRLSHWNTAAIFGPEPEADNAESI